VHYQQPHIPHHHYDDYDDDNDDDDYDDDDDDDDDDDEYYHSSHHLHQYHPHHLLKNHYRHHYDNHLFANEMQHKLEQAQVLDQIQHRTELADFVAKSRISDDHLDLMQPNYPIHNLEHQIDDYHHDQNEEMLSKLNLVNGHHQQITGDLIDGGHGFLGGGNGLIGGGHGLLSGGHGLLGGGYGQQNDHQDINNFANLAEIAEHTTLNEYGDVPGHSRSDSHGDDAVRLQEQLHSADLMTHSEMNDPVDASPLGADESESESNAENRELSNQSPHLHSPHILKSLDFGGADPVSIADRATYTLSPLARQISDTATKVTAQNLFQKFSAMDNNLIHSVNQPELAGSNPAAVTGDVRRHHAHRQNHHYQAKQNHLIEEQSIANSSKRNSLDEFREKKQRELEEMLHSVIKNATKANKQKKNVIEMMNTDLQNDRQASSIKRTIKKLDEVIDVLKSQPTARSTIPMHIKRRKTKKTRKNIKPHHNYKKKSKNQAAERSHLPLHLHHKKQVKPSKVNSNSNSTTYVAKKFATDKAGSTRNSSTSTADNGIKQVKTVDENNQQYQLSKLKKLNISLMIQKKYINYKHMVNLLRGQSRSVPTLGPYGNYTEVEKEMKLAEGKVKNKTVALTEASRLSRNPEPTGDNRLLFDSPKNVSLSKPTVASTSKGWYLTNKPRIRSDELKEITKTNRTKVKDKIHEEEKEIFNVKHVLEQLRDDIKVRYAKYKKLKRKFQDQTKSAIKLEPDFGKDLTNITTDLVKEQTKSIAAFSATIATPSIARGLISRPKPTDNALKNPVILDDDTVNNISNDIMKRSHPTASYKNNDGVQSVHQPTSSWVIEVE